MFCRKCIHDLWAHTHSYGSIMSSLLGCQTQTSTQRDKFKYQYIGHNLECYYCMLWWFSIKSMSIQIGFLEFSSVVKEIAYCIIAVYGSDNLGSPMVYTWIDGISSLWFLCTLRTKFLSHFRAFRKSVYAFSCHDNIFSIVNKWKSYIISVNCRF